MTNRTLALAVALVSVAVLGLGAPVGPKAYHVATTGSDTNPGTATQPFKTITKAVSVVLPGDSILVHAGTYPAVVTINKSGTSALPITLAGAGDGVALIKPNLPTASCSATVATRDRAIQIYSADYWTITGLSIAGGILVYGNNQHKIASFTSRTLPGRGVYDPTAAATLLPKLGVDPADHIRILNNKITGRGIQSLASRWGEVTGNEISNTACGTGAFIWINRFSDFWKVTNNYIHDNAVSAEHRMEEGIRQGSGSSYNLIANNLVENLANRGRGITTDVMSSWNVIQGNTVRRAYHGFNEQHGGWGNQWIGNLSEFNRKFGMSIDGKDGGLTSPNDGVPAKIVFRCNVARNNGKTDLSVGAVQQSSFSNNAFGSVKLDAGVRTYWSRVGNTWDGSSAMPPTNPPQKTCS
ncbi:MAG TPA: DUF1565 domain-containing protein [Gemmatimonadota bacterium]